VVQFSAMVDGQLAAVVQRLDTEAAVQWGGVPPSRTSVAQQIGVLPLQSDGWRHESVSATAHDVAQAMV